MTKTKTLNRETESLKHVVQHYLCSYFEEHPEILKAQSLYEVIMREVEKPLITLVLEKTSYNQSEAALILGINRNTLRKKMTTLRIKAK